MPADPLRSLRDAVASDPDDAIARGRLAELLLAAGSVTEAFSHLAVAYDLGLSDPASARHTQFVLESVAAMFARDAGRATAPAGAPVTEPAAPEPPAAEPPAPDPPAAEAPGPARLTIEGDRPAGVSIEFVRPTITLADVAGLDDVKQHIHVKLLAPLRNRAIAERYGRTPTGGLLMWGPPGCGKTFIARALAGTLDVSFSGVGMDEILDMYIGASERNLASLFAAARREAPCVLFFDETDAIGGRRSRMGLNVAMRSVVSQLLTELDGAVHDNTGVFTVGASNLPWDIDPALRRPGRFDRTLFVPPPDRFARIGILATKLSTIPLGTDIDLDRIARASRGRSGADVAHIAETAIDAAFTAAVDTGRDTVVDQALLERATATTSTSIEDWVLTARTAAEASNDVDLYGPFLSWLDRRDGDR